MEFKSISTEQMKQAVRIAEEENAYGHINLRDVNDLCWFFEGLREGRDMLVLFNSFDTHIRDKAVAIYDQVK